MNTIKQYVWVSRQGAAMVCASAAVMLAACGGGGGGGADAGAGAAPVQSQTSTAAATPSTTTTASTTTPVSAPAPATTTPSSASLGGTEQRINSTTAGNQVGAAVARLASGGHLVAWNSQSADGATAICAQRFDGAGATAGAETCTPTAAATTGAKPAVAALAGGGYVLAWVVRDDGAAQTGVRAQRYDAGGAPVGAEQKVNLRSADDLYPVAAAGLPDGGWVVAWKSTQPASDILVRRFDAAGAPQGEEQRANVFLGRSGGNRQNPTVAALAGGGWIVGWSSQFQDGASGSAIYVQRFGTDGAPVGTETRVSDPAQNSMTPALAPLPGGGWLLAWQADERVLAQRFAADGTALESAAQVDASEVAAACYERTAPLTCRITQRTPAVAALDDGGHVVAWNAGPGNLLYARRFASQGTAGSVTQLTDGPAPAAAATGAAGFVIAWHTWDRDGDMGGIYGRRFDGQALR